MAATQSGSAAQERLELVWTPPQEYDYQGQVQFQATLVANSSSWQLVSHNISLTFYTG